MNKTVAYWWESVPNFGDGLAPLLLDHFADTQVEWGTISRAKVVSIGSVLEHVPPLWDGIILGSGRLLEGSRLHLQRMGGGTSAKVLSIRGPMSAKGIPGSYTLGDPGILANELVGHQDKRWDLGIVPHFSDTELVGRFTAMFANTKRSIRVIHPSSDPLLVLREMGACHRIVTSSLHGMIVSDAFGIPRRVEYTTNMNRDGGDFKFRDYSASIQMKFVTGKMQEPARTVIEDLKFNVYDAYRSLKGEL